MPDLRQILAQHFQVSRLINTGIAGSLDAGIDIGDMVISTDAVQHDVTQKPLAIRWDRFLRWMCWHFRRIRSL